MSSAVTSTTVSTLSGIQIAGAFGLLLILAMITVFVLREIVDTTSGTIGGNWSPALKIATVPFMVAFAIILVINVTTFLE